MKSAKPIIKVCGITQENDVTKLVEAGVNWFGINLYEPSPRSVDLKRAEKLLSIIPVGQRVLVDVLPSIAKLKACKTAGFDRFQIHFNPEDLPATKLSDWAKCLGKQNLWLAPKIPPDSDFPKNLLAFADTFILDAYSKSAFGGTGKIGNWGLFRDYKTLYPSKTWILAGGLSPLNLQEAIQATGTEFVDLNSGFETAPGIKDTALLASAIQAL